MYRAVFMLDKKCWHRVRLNMGYNCNNEDYLAAITRRVFMETAAARDTWCDGHVRCDPVWPRGPVGSHHRGSDKCGSWKPNWISGRAPPWCRHPSDAAKLFINYFQSLVPTLGRRLGSMGSIYHGEMSRYRWWRWAVGTIVKHLKHTGVRGLVLN